MLPVVVDSTVGEDRVPKLHALLVGVSDYPNLPKDGEPMPPSAYGLRKLSSPAISAFRIFEWLRKCDSEGSLPLPLAMLPMTSSSKRCSLSPCRPSCFPDYRLERIVIGRRQRAEQSNSLGRIGHCSQIRFPHSIPMAGHCLCRRSSGSRR